MEVKNSGNVAEKGGDDDDGDHNQRIIFNPPTTEVDVFRERSLQCADHPEMPVEAKVKNAPSSQRISGNPSEVRPVSLTFQGEDDSDIRQGAVNRQARSVFHSRNEFLPPAETETCPRNLKEPESENANVTIKEDDQPASIPTAEFLTATEERIHTAPAPRPEITSPAEKKLCRTRLELAVDGQGLIYVKEIDVFDQGQCSVPLPRTEFLPPTEHHAEPMRHKRRDSVAVDGAESTPSISPPTAEITPARRQGKRSLERNKEEGGHLVREHVWQQRSTGALSLPVTAQSGNLEQGPVLDDQTGFGSPAPAECQSTTLEEEMSARSTAGTPWETNDEEVESRAK